MTIQKGDYVVVEGCSEEVVEKIKAAMVAAGYRAYSLGGQIECDSIGISSRGSLLYQHTIGMSGGHAFNGRELTIEEVLGEAK